MTVSADPILLEVFRGKLDVIANEMEATLLRSSYSSLIKEALDATAALFDQQGRTLAQADALPAHLGVMVAGMERVVSAYPVGVAARGDVYIMNDPYDGGTHLPDFLLAIPVFSRGILVGYAATMSHHQDVAGSAPGSTAPDAVDVHAEGLRIPLMKLLNDGVMNDTLLTVISSNTRVPKNLQGDLDAQRAACATGARRLREICDEWGPDVVADLGEELMDYAERLTRISIENLPDGRYGFVDYLDDDGVSDDQIAIRVTVEVKGSELHCDFTGTDKQAKGAINCVESSTLAGVYFVVRSLTGAHIPNNAGCYRPVSVTLPPGSIVNCNYPAPVGARVITMKRVVDALFGALAQVAPSHVPAASSGQVNIMYVGGVDEASGEHYVGFIGVPLPGGMGARPTKDGIDVVETDVTNNLHYPTEACEGDLPMRIESIGLWTDSGGAGHFRGGLGYTSEVVWLGGEALVTIRRDRHRFPPWGLAGGHPGWPCRSTILKVDGTIEELPSKAVFAINRGDRLRIWTAGGGGYGPPTERDPEAVLADVLDGRVSIACAEQVYGVAFSGDEIDLSRTRVLRSTQDERLAPEIVWGFGF